MERPWAVDDLEAALNALTAPHAKAMIFVDNAGSDVVLGAVPHRDVPGASRDAEASVRKPLSTRLQPIWRWKE